MSSALTVVLLAACASAAHPATVCKRSMTQVLKGETASVAAGTYRIVFVATKGDKKGARTDGVLTLRHSPPDTRIQPEGEHPVGWDWDPKQLIGTLDANPTLVGAANVRQRVRSALH